MPWVENIPKYGNTSAASIPIALCEALEEGRAQVGDTLVFVSFGAGLTWATAVVKLAECVKPTRARKWWQPRLKWFSRNDEKEETLESRAFQNRRRWDMKTLIENVRVGER